MYWNNPLHYSPPDSFSPLHLASYFGIISLADKLLSRQRGSMIDFSSYVNKSDGQGATPLSYAAVYGYEDLVLLLLERGAIVDARSDEDSFYSPLIVASYSGNKRVVKLLLDKGADISAQSQYRTAILLASAKGNVEVVQLLQDRGAIVDDTNRYHNNALQIASLKGNAEVVWLLLKAGADVNSLSLEGKTALDLAVKGRHQMIERGLRSSAQSYEEVIQLLREAQSQEGPNKAKRRRRAGQL